MKFDFLMPVDIISGAGCVKANARLFNLGKRCLIVTGKSSAVKSGALADVIGVLDALNIGYFVYDKVRENPLMSMCGAGGSVAIADNADFVIGIGGGSAIDAAKAIAAYAGNPTITGSGIFTDAVDPSLPLIAIPTTAGTGSEANNYAILSLDGENKKRTFKNAYSYAKYAFLDPRYTYSLSVDYTVSTALDAFCHCIESYMSPKSTAISEMMALYGARHIFSILKAGADMFTEGDREALLYASCAAGIAINSTGTGFPHPMGYNLTMFKGIPHGKACAAFTGEFIRYTRNSDEGIIKTDSFAEGIGYSLDEIANLTALLADVKLKLTAEEIDMFIQKVKTASNFANNPYIISEDEMGKIYGKLFG